MALALKPRLKDATSASIASDADFGRPWASRTGHPLRQHVAERGSLWNGQATTQKTSPSLHEVVFRLDEFGELRAVECGMDPALTFKTASAWARMVMNHHKEERGRVRKWILERWVCLPRHLIAQGEKIFNSDKGDTERPAAPCRNARAN
jgi:hypothetical protein